VPWKGAEVCQQNCLSTKLFGPKYTGACADKVAAAANCWAQSLTCSNGTAQIGSNTYGSGGPVVPAACSDLQAAAKDCVNQCAL